MCSDCDGAGNVSCGDEGPLDDGPDDWQWNEWTPDEPDEPDEGRDGETAIAPDAPTAK